MEKYEYVDQCNIRWKVMLKLLSIYFCWLSFLGGLGLLIIGILFEVYYYIGITLGLWVIGIVAVNISYAVFNHYKCEISERGFEVLKSKGYKKFKQVAFFNFEDIESITLGEICENKLYNGNGEVFTLRTRDGRSFTLCTDLYMLALLKGSIK